MIDSFAFRLVIDPQNTQHQELMSARLAAVAADPQFLAGILPEVVGFSLPTQRNQRVRSYFESRRDGVWLKALSIDRNEWFDTLDSEEFPDVSPVVEHAVLVDRLAKMIEPWQFDMIRIHGHAPHNESVKLGFYQQPNIWAELESDFGRQGHYARKYELESDQDLASTLEFFRQLLAGELELDSSTMTVSEMLQAFGPAYDLVVTHAHRHGKDYEIQELVWSLEGTRLPTQCFTDAHLDLIQFTG